MLGWTWHRDTRRESDLALQGFLLGLGTAHTWQKPLPGGDLDVKHVNYTSSDLGKSRSWMHNTSRLFSSPIGRTLTFSQVSYMSCLEVIPYSGSITSCTCPVCLSYSHAHADCQKRHGMDSIIQCLCSQRSSVDRVPETVTPIQSRYEVNK